MKTRKRQLWNWLAAIMVAMLSIGLAGCGGDDDSEDGIVGSINSALTGGWRGTPVSGSGAIICVFGSDGSLGVAVSSSAGKTTEWQGHYSFTGMPENGVVTATWSDGSEERIVTANITTNTMILQKDGINYDMTRADIEDEDNGGSNDNGSTTPTKSTCSTCKGTGVCSITLIGCKGTGKCYSCHGSGRQGSGSFSFKCTACAGTGKCRVCGGSGLCKSCGGSGVR